MCCCWDFDLVCWMIVFVLCVWYKVWLDWIMLSKILLVRMVYCEDKLFLSWICVIVFCSVLNSINVLKYFCVFKIDLVKLIKELSVLICWFSFVKFIFCVIILWIWFVCLFNVSEMSRYLSVFLFSGYFLCMVLNWIVVCV